MTDALFSARAWFFGTATAVALFAGTFAHQHLNTFWETLLAGIVIMCFLAIFMEPKK